MSVISRLILAQPDPRLADSLRFAFEREGARVDALSLDGELDPSPLAEPAELIIAGGRTAEEAETVMKRVQGALLSSDKTLPVLYVGNAIERDHAVAAGASEVLGKDCYARDAVTIARLLAGPKPDKPEVLVGDLADHFGVFFLVRALVHVKRHGVLTLVRGLRRGELRFFNGEVTSAQVGLLHGLAAFHQLLLWTEGRYELRHEDVVRRRQIPLEPEELLADGERFLGEIFRAAGGLVPAAIYKRDEAQVKRVQGNIPDAVDAVLRLFDGQRTVGDVVEDSAFRVFETLKLAKRLSELGLIRLVSMPPERQQAVAALAIDEWLVGRRQERGGTHVLLRKGESVGPPPGQPASPPKKRKKQRKNKKAARARSSSAPAASEPLVVDWAQLLPQPAGDGGGLSPVVPSTVAAGEIGVSPGGGGRVRRATEPPPPRAPTRERIEEVAPAETLVKLFSTEERAPVSAEPVSPPVVEDMSDEVVSEPNTGPVERVDGGDVEPSADELVPRPPILPAAQQASAPSAGEAPAEPSQDTGELPDQEASSAADGVASGEIRVRPSTDPGRQDEPAVSVSAELAGDETSAKPAAEDKAGAEVPTSRAVTPVERPVPAAEPAAKPAAAAESAKPAAAAESAKPAASAKSAKPAASAKSAKPIPEAEGGQFTADEEAFFAAGANLAQREAEPIESFDDLDEGYDLPQSFLQRLFQRPDRSLGDSEAKPSTPTRATLRKLGGKKKKR